MSHRRAAVFILLLLPLGTYLQLTSPLTPTQSYRKYQTNETASTKLNGSKSAYDRRTSNHNLSATSFPNATLEFSQEFISSTPKRICGLQKCLFEMKIKGAFSTAYLASDQYKPLRKPMKQAWDMIQNRFNDSWDHIYMAPPQRVLISPDFGAWLDQNKSRIGHEDEPDSIEIFFEQNSYAIVQKVRLIQQDRSLLIGGAENKQRLGWGKAQELMAKVLSEAKTEVTRDELLGQLNSSWKRVRDVVRLEPCLFHDFQLLWQADDARFVHLDVDRCFRYDGTARSPPGWKQRLFLRRVRLFVDFARASLTSGVVPNATEMLAQSLGMEEEE